MPKFLTVEEVILRCQIAHKGFYTYDPFEYKGNTTKMPINCPIHGPFTQRALHHMNGHRCKWCGVASSAKNRCYTHAELVKRMTEAHDGFYSYELFTKYEHGDWDKPIPIICPIHGEYLQLIELQISGRGCSACGGVKRVSFEDFVRRAREVHGDRYEYDFQKIGELENITKHIPIHCRKHGDFQQSPKMHMNGDGCRYCRSRPR